MPRKSSKKRASAASARQGSRAGRGTWRLMDRAATVAGALLAREVSVLTWRAATGRKPPTVGRHPDVGTREAVAWAVVGGALVELVKLLVRRWTATYWVRSTGDLPPGLRPLGQAPRPAVPAPTTEPTSRRKSALRRSR